MSPSRFSSPRCGNPPPLALFARLAAERGFEPEDVTETLGVAPGVGFRRLAEAQRAEMQRARAETAEGRAKCDLMKRLIAE